MEFKGVVPPREAQNLSLGESQDFGEQRKKEQWTQTLVKVSICRGKKLSVKFSKQILAVITPYMCGVGDSSVLAFKSLRCCATSSEMYHTRYEKSPAALSQVSGSQIYEYMYVMNSQSKFYCSYVRLRNIEDRQGQFPLTFLYISCRSVHSTM